MSEEEIIKTLNYQLKMKDTDVYTPINYDAIQGLLDIYTKQKKEIKELSIIKNSIQTLETHFVNDDTYYVIAKENFLEGDFRHLLDDYISKDKIKGLIQEIESYAYTSLEEKEKQDYAIYELKRLL